MKADNTTAIATMIVVFTGAFWGLYWLPVRGLDGLGLSGPWGTLAIVFCSTVALTPFAWRARTHLLQTSPMALASVALGGFAFFLYSVGFLYGRVAVIVILFFLSPVWSTLIGRLFMGWSVPPQRALVLIFGLGGLGLMLGAEGGVPVPRGLGEWLGLISGFLWSVASTGIRARVDTGPLETAFVFSVGALIGAAVFAPIFAPLPVQPDLGALWAAFGVAAATGAIWWGASMAGLMWATPRLDPARVGILLMSEVLVGAISAAILAGERLNLLEWLGGALVVLAGILEVTTSRKATGP